MLKTVENQFFIKHDGTFNAHFGDVILKAEKVGDTEGWHFSAVASTSDKDREGETLLQKGLNFTPFTDSGEYNWNHMSHAMVGVPVGKKAWFENNKWMCEGMILKDMPITKGYSTNEVVQQHNTLKKSGLQRGLCCSVEGKVIERSDDGKYVKKADIYNIALTFRPVNPNCSLTMLAKSLDKGAELSINDEFYKALSVQNIGSFMKEDLEGASSKKENLGRKLVKHLVKKGFSEADATIKVYDFMKNKLLGMGSGGKK